MTIGDVFAKAWELWRRDVGWLILAGLVVGLIVGVIAVVVVAIVVGMSAVSIAGLSVDASGDVNSISGLSAGSFIGALVVGIIGYLIVSVLAMVFYGGLFEMVIGAARENRGVVFGDLFSGFRKFGSFIVYWLVMVGIGIVCGLVFLIPVLGWIAVPVFLCWLGTTWLYVLPLIADRGMTFGEAARASSQMVKGVGWWKTFGTIIVLGVAVALGGARHRPDRRSSSLAAPKWAGHRAAASSSFLAVRRARAAVRDLLPQHDVPGVRRRGGRGAGGRLRCARAAGLRRRSVRDAARRRAAVSAARAAVHRAAGRSGRTDRRHRCGGRAASTGGRCRRVEGRRRPAVRLAHRAAGGSRESRRRAGRGRPGGAGRAASAGGARDLILRGR